METTAPLILIALVAIVVVVGILWGMRLKRQRDTTERTVSSNRAAAEPALPESAPESIIAPLAPPVAPSPPPLADEPIVAAAPLDASPASIAADVSDAPSAPEPAAAARTDLTQLKGLGPKLVAALAELGITRIDQIAALSPDQAADLDARLGNFRGRLARDRWIEQARLLAAGDRAAYEAEFGKLG
ncbi:hypothetical protein NDN01_22800 [Sphingomonas sp. QA11]|uniref:hypothetical protein n=1 Tax=Sphingomonas sp. QA11 TaxID=2950605 RepID=UPI00234A6EE6|nr:hypothetical protein [Sphingomonas sp. QA11]WCM26790.1 hypothetical protein NDN01_22800 [Sphingomonas sp. QA11]